MLRVPRPQPSHLKEVGTMLLALFVGACATTSTPRAQGQLADVPDLDAHYTTAASRARTVTILGSSSSSPAIADAMAQAEHAARALVRRGYNVVTGCGREGIMGAAYKGAFEASQEKAESGASRGENLAIVTLPLWGDEDLEHVHVIGTASSEADRIRKFREVSSTFFIFPGGAGTLQELATLVTYNRYLRGDDVAVRIFLIGAEFYAPLWEQYRAMEKAGTLGVEAGTLVTLVGSADEALEAPQMK